MLQFDPEAESNCNVLKSKVLSDLFRIKSA